ncbi:DUF6286 domain-containing protein [Leifsonia sp. AG29]|uniref:DUF6286 domain-containing protein n=1 Tax=Leifsonia sp. AG29 TaxID=2598860 RepID=UPI00131C99B9|nr:DUF6286 domain-containing protein [Leifsonia sp. AG29]
MTRTGARIVRRETHSPRSAAAVAVAAVLLAVVVWLAVEGVLALLGLRPALLAPRALLTAIAEAPGWPAPALIATASAASLIAVVLVALAVFPGRRARRPLASERALVVADDDMLASALARRAAKTAAVAPDAVSASLGRRACTVRIVPVSGRRVDRDAVRRAVAEEFERSGATERVRVSVLVSTKGKVGS